MTAPLPVRDFVYLDVERLKSILAQVDEGYLEKTDSTQTATGSAKADVEVSVPLLAKAGGTGEYLSSNQMSETRTLHDHIYNYVEKRLSDEGRLYVLHEELTPTGWLDDEVRSDINETSFVLVRGAPLVNDYAFMKEFLGDLNKVAAAIARFDTSGKLDGLTKPQAKSARNAAASHYLVEDQTLKDLSLVLKTFVRNDLIVKIMPFDDHPDARVTTNLDVVAALRMQLHSLVFRFGSAPRRPWTLFGQIASIPLSDDVPYKYAGTLGAELDTAFQGMFSALRGLEALVTSVRYPEICVIPIALYRG